jgi:hypothetical protein
MRVLNIEFYLLEKVIMNLRINHPFLIFYKIFKIEIFIVLHLMKKNIYLDVYLSKYRK